MKSKKEIRGINITRNQRTKNKGNEKKNNLLKRMKEKTDLQGKGIKWKIETMKYEKLITNSRTKQKKEIRKE